ncbi:MAG TPA: DUF4173 domain-containing protein [Pyrinomonadaceae bacterium]|nr:DUF4173 domain-containing protein [Pyrinomonadaceae bacterium]
MTEKTKLGLSVLEAALLLGLLGDALLRAVPWGLNVFLWFGVLAAACFALARQRRVPLAAEGRWLLPSALAFAAAFAWRDSATLRFLDAIAILVLLALVTLRARGGRVRLAGMTDYVLAGVVTGVSALFGGLLLLFNDIGWKEIPRDGWSKHVFAVLRGLAIGLPVVLVFGALFAAADAIYDGLIRSTFNFDSDIAVSHVLIFLAFTWLSAGFLRTAFAGPTEMAGAGLPAHVALGFNDAHKPDDKEKGTASTATKGAADFKTAGASGFKVESVTRDEKSPDAPPASVTDSKHDEVMSAPPSVTEDPPAPTPPTEPSTETGPASPPDAQSAATSSTTDAAPSPSAETSSAPSFAESVGVKGISLGVVEVGVVLGLLNALFLSFVFVQLRYFFGGSEVVLSSADMTYAEYARRGFFELVWVAALVLPLLLGVHWMLRKENPAHERIFRALSGGLLLMLFVIMASAVGRMRLYQSEYGQTELRFYVTAFMGWLAVVFVWFALTVLRGERERFACGALVAAVAIVGALHFTNPNALIVRTNAALARERRVFDAPYASSLGADAVPALLEALPEMRSHERAQVASNLLVWAAPVNTDWRSWNWSRSRARGAVAEQELMLREWAKQQPPPPSPLPNVVAEQAVGVLTQAAAVEPQPKKSEPSNKKNVRQAKGARRTRSGGQR